MTNLNESCDICKRCFHLNICKYPTELKTAMTNYGHLIHENCKFFINVAIDKPKPVVQQPCQIIKPMAEKHTLPFNEMNSLSFFDKDIINIKKDNKVKLPSAVDWLLEAMLFIATNKDKFTSFEVEYDGLSISEFFHTHFKSNMVNCRYVTTALIELNVLERRYKNDASGRYEYKIKQMTDAEVSYAKAVIKLLYDHKFAISNLSLRNLKLFIDKNLKH